MKRISYLLCSLALLGAGCSSMISKTPEPTPPAQQPAAAPGPTRSATVTLENGRVLHLNIASPYTLRVMAQGLKHVRFMAKSPDDRLFIGEMRELGDSNAGRVLILNGMKISVYLSGLRNPNSIAFYTDPTGKTWLYVALTDKLVRYAYQAGDMKPEGNPETVAKFPDYGESFLIGGWHLTRTIVVHRDKLYVSVGSSCNSCEEKASETQRGTILEMDPDGGNQIVYANGLRNAVGIEFDGDDLYATDNGADHLGDDRPEDRLIKIQKGVNYGWPYCYQLKGAVYADTSKKWKNAFDCTQVPVSLYRSDPHSAPLGFDIIDGRFLVALHGSGNKTIGNGYKVISVGKDGAAADFLTGLLTDGKVNSRIVDVLKNDDHSFFITDDFNGAIYKIEKSK